MPSAGAVGSTADVNMTDANGEEKKVEEAPLKTYPIAALADLKHKYEQTKDVQVLNQIMAYVREEKMSVFYEKVVVGQFGVPLDKSFLEQLKKTNEAELAEIEKKHAAALEEEGDIEVKNALMDKADLFNRIGDKDKAVAAYDVAHKKTVGVGGRMDVTLTKVRLGLFWDDKKLTKQSIADAHAELKKGGDWERKNKLKVYEGLFKITTQDYAGAASLLLDSVATFTATELLSFSDFIFYAVLMAMVGLPRKTVKKALGLEFVIKSPEILSAIHETPHMKDFLLSFYNCDYATFMKEFVHVIDIMRADRYTSASLIKLTRQIRLNVYTQFITSYKSVTLASMAQTFGVSPAFIDREIYGFISSGKLLCKIDKVNGVIETQFETTQTKSKAYKDIIKEGDNLLNKMQKLASAIDR